MSSAPRAAAAEAEQFDDEPRVRDEKPGAEHISVPVTTSTCRSYEKRVGT